jgi:flagellar protein FliO/FliZ
VPPEPAPINLDRPPLDDLKPDRPDLEGGESLIGSLFKTLLVLGLVLALVYVSLNWGLRKLMRLSPVARSVVKVHERVPLDAKKTVFLVEVGDEFLLLGAGEREVSYLTRLDPERARAALAKKAERPADPLKGKPFWERLVVKPPPKPPSSAQGGSQQT